MITAAAVLTSYSCASQLPKAEIQFLTIAGDELAKAYRLEVPTLPKMDYSPKPIDKSKGGRLRILPTPAYNSHQLCCYSRGKDITKNLRVWRLYGVSKYYRPINDIINLYQPKGQEIVLHFEDSNTRVLHIRIRANRDMAVF